MAAQRTEFWWQASRPEGPEVIVEVIPDFDQEAYRDEIAAGRAFPVAVILAMARRSLTWPNYAAFWRDVASAEEGHAFSEQRWHDALMVCLRNLWSGFTHEHAAHCWTSWSARGATYCWICERAVTETPVPGYALVDRDGVIVRGHRGGVPTVGFFLTLTEAAQTNVRVGLDAYTVVTATADRAGVSVDQPTP